METILEKSTFVVAVGIETGRHGASFVSNWLICCNEKKRDVWNLILNASFIKASVSIQSTFATVVRGERPVSTDKQEGEKLLCDVRRTETILQT